MAKDFYMKLFFKYLLLSIFLLFTPISTPIIQCAAPAGVGIADAFKDLSEAELMKAIEESQKALEDLLTNGTPEQKAEFEKALTELAENLSPEDWKELQAIGEVYEKNNPSVKQPETPKEPAKTPTYTPPVEKKPEVKTTPVPEKTKESQFEASIKEALEVIIKNIDNMFHILSSHRDLSHKLKLWEEKSSFQELKSLLIRLKKHVNRLSKKDPENKVIIDNLYAFKKDLEAENKRIALAQDDFGLENPMTSEQANHTLTRVTLVLSTGINNLLPSLIEFFKKYEPEALEEAKKKDTQKAKAKEHEKNAHMRRPSNPYYSTAPSNYNHGNYNQMPQRKYRPSDMQNGFYQGSNGKVAKNDTAKEHKPDFGGFDMSIKRGTIQGGRAVPNPEKKKDDKDKDKKDADKDDSDKKEEAKKAEAKKIEVNQNFIKGMTKLVTEITAKLNGSRFKETLDRAQAPKFTAQAQATPITPTQIHSILKVALNKGATDISIIKQEFIKNLVLAANYKSSHLDEIVLTNSEAIFALIIEYAKDPDQTIEAILNNAVLNGAINKTAAEINADKDMQATETDSLAKINQFENLAKRISEDIAKYSGEIDDIVTIINSLQPALGKVPQADLSKFINSPAFKSFETKVQEYAKAIQSFRSKIDKQKDENLKHISSRYESKYLDIHRALYELPNNIATSIASANNNIAAFKKSLSLPTLFA